jgi:hypothetical protein
MAKKNSKYEKGEMKILGIAIRIFLFLYFSIAFYGAYLKDDRFSMIGSGGMAIFFLCGIVEKSQKDKPPKN